MLKRLRIAHLFFISSLFYVIAGHSLEFDQKVIIEGFLRRAESAHITRDSNGKEKTKIEKSIVLVSDKPLVYSRSVKVGNREIAVTNTAYTHIEVCLPEEFLPLIGKHVQCNGYFKNSSYPFGDELLLDVGTVLDCDQLTHQQKIVFYEPEEVELFGMLHETIYPGPPEYMNIETGDLPEKVIILTLKDPIHVDVLKDDDFNQPEKGVREIQVAFAESRPTAEQMKNEISLKGTLYHAHTAHHRRRVLMSVKDWKSP